MPPMPANPVVEDPLLHVDMGGQFSVSLKLGPPLVAEGPFAWKDCYLMSVFISQSGGRAASEMARPDIQPDPDKAGGTIWVLDLKTTPGANKLKAGRAFASSVALINDNGAVGLVQWGEFITLK